MSLAPISLALAFVLASCVTDRSAGTVVSHMMNERLYVQFERNGRPDSAAVFRHEGRWWFYHPKFGSVETASAASGPPPLWCRHATKKLKGATNLRFAETRACSAPHLANGCLPRAIVSQRRYGGRIVQTGPWHVENIR